MTRRVICASIDPKCERPENLGYETRPREIVAARRGELLVAALTVLRAFVVAGRPFKVDPLASFEAWSDWVRAALMWLGEADPCSTMDRVRDSDPKRLQEEALFAHWERAVGSKPVTVAELVAKANLHDGQDFSFPDLRQVLAEISGQRGLLAPGAIGTYLRGIRHKIVDGRRLTQAGKRHNSAVWFLDVVSASRADDSIAAQTCGTLRLV